MRADLKEEIEIPEKTKVKLDKGIFTVEGSKGEVSKRLLNPKIKAEIKDNSIILSCEKASKREKTLMGAFKSHLNNLIKGANQGHEYVLKICSGHFPMKVTASKEELVINNFIGEKHPRKLKLKPEVEVKLDNDQITVSSTSKELAGQTAADIEQITRRNDYDRRIFQDGIYIINKDGKEIR
ncbi:50S ribosomal protein L6 [Candidatus Woesearchaeota archaeon]|nr:50S ribosomal protein L6 [Candidatus Woesearchaeota archaeon]